ncbi:hypothetical protein RCL_jg2751.t1 [Rhizophagus clarus]|uniref:DUF4371 domain-containing protein n=1 Tax=Rhizophagus clarus TaxID=94130 RepID=A0A8H3M347_9GLOM|nr:hypothetical protein RCL_jg2751.t1 [Rhizophagus clarus]
MEKYFKVQYPWLVRREDRETPLCIWCEERKANNIFVKGLLKLVIKHRPPPLHLQTLPLTSTFSNYAKYKNPKAGLNFIKSISYAIEHQVIEEINQSVGCSILLDESTTITIMAIISKHMVGNELVLQYLEVMELCNDRKNNGVAIKLKKKPLSLQIDIIIDDDGAELAKKLLEECALCHYHLNSTILAIWTMFIGSDDTSPTYGKHLLEYVRNNQLSIDAILGILSQFA